MATASIAYLLLFTLFAASCEKGKKGEILTQGRVETPTGEVIDHIKLKGVFAPSRQLQIKSGFSGQLTNLSAKEGQSIAKGTPLFTIEDEELPLTLEHQQALLKEAEDQQKLSANETTVEQAPEEESSEETEVSVIQPTELRVRLPMELQTSWTPPSGYWVPVPGRPEDAGGVWPQVRITQSYAAMSGDPEDAGGIWPDYGPRRRVMGDEEFSVREPEYSGTRASNLGRSYRTMARRPTVVQTYSPETSPEAIPEILPSQEQASSSTDLDQAKVDRIKAEIAITERQLAGRTILSPIDGIIKTVMAYEEEQVEPNKSIVELIQVDPIELILKMPKEKINRLEKGETADVQIPNLPGQTFTGEISFIGINLDTDMKSVEVRVRVANPDFSIKPGMDGTAEIAVAKKE